MKTLLTFVRVMLVSGLCVVCADPRSASADPVVFNWTIPDTVAASDVVIGRRVPVSAVDTGSEAPFHLITQSTAGHRFYHYRNRVQVGHGRRDRSRVRGRRF